ncbi:hypothetical protein DM813_27215 [Pseudomonas alkylphenolica]|uniref:Uncharacterized protein n=2 Tax=Pseudomonas alkylphenolica TaxID=237609 RepID=A0A443ZEE0_9PSED|nr:hypothetical protein DM813_27215 [Pseudomonas alkylphenolica]
MVRISNDASNVRNDVPLPNAGKPFYWKIEKLGEGPHRVTGGGSCYEFEGTVVINTSTRRLSDMKLAFKRDFSCAFVKDLMIEDDTSALLGFMNSYEVRSGKVFLKQKSGKTNLKFMFEEEDKCPLASMKTFKNY